MEAWGHVGMVHPLTCMACAYVQVGRLLPGQVVTIIEERLAEDGEVRDCMPMPMCISISMCHVHVPCECVCVHPTRVDVHVHVCRCARASLSTRSATASTARV